MKPSYSTTNLWVASLAVLSGVPVVAIEATMPRCVIHLDNTDDRAWEVAKAFYTGHPTVDLRDLVNARAGLVKLIQDARERAAA